MVWASPQTQNKLIAHLGMDCGVSKFDVLANVDQGRISSRRFASHSLNLTMKSRKFKKDIFLKKISFYLTTGEATLRLTGRFMASDVWNWFFKII